MLNYRKPLVAPIAKGILGIRLNWKVIVKLLLCRKVITFMIYQVDPKH